MKIPLLGNMELTKGRKLRRCRLVAANAVPNKKRLAQRSQRPHRLHLTWRRKIPMFLWGAFSPPGLNAGEERWKRGILYYLPEISHFLQQTPGIGTGSMRTARHVGLDKNDLLMEVAIVEVAPKCELPVPALVSCPMLKLP